MKQRIPILLFGLGISIALLVFMGSSVHPTAAASAYQAETCEDSLKKILVRAGWGGVNNNPDVEGCRYFLVASNYYLDLNLILDPSGGMSVFCSDTSSVPPCTETSFHGYPATTAISNGSGSIRWLMPRGGTEYYFDIFVGEGYDVIQFAEEILSAAEIELPITDQVIPIPEVPPDQTDPLDVPTDETDILNAPCDGVTPEDFRIGSQESMVCRLLCEEKFWQSDEEIWACISYYGGQSGVNVPGIPNNLPGGDVPANPDGTSIPMEPGGLFGIPAVVILGSLGIPIAGAVAGAVFSALLSGFSSAAVSSPGASAAPGIQGNEQGLYWSERPWDVAGPGYVSKEEYVRTQDLLEQGYKWTKDGWKTPTQITESNQLQQNNQQAVARENAEWQAQMEGERQALEQKKAELKKTEGELQAAVNLFDLKDGLETINQELLSENIYVVNPLQGDPTLVFDGLSKVGNIGWDLTAGWVTPSNGMTCGDYVGETLGKVKKIISDQVGPGAKVEGIIFEERSTKTPQGVLDWFDRLNPDNHNLIKVTLPDGREFAVDFHQHNTGKKPPIMRPWNEAKKVWQDYMGEEFMERISVH